MHSVSCPSHQLGWKMYVGWVAMSLSPPKLQGKSCLHKWKSTAQARYYHWMPPKVLFHLGCIYPRLLHQILIMLSDCSFLLTMYPSIKCRIFNLIFHFNSLLFWHCQWRNYSATDVITMDSSATNSSALDSQNYRCNANFTSMCAYTNIIPVITNLRGQYDLIWSYISGWTNRQTHLSKPLNILQGHIFTFRFEQKPGIKLGCCFSR